MTKQAAPGRIDGLKFSTILLLIASLLLFIISSVTYRKFVLMSDRNVFWGAIENSLQLNTVQSTIDQSQDGTVSKSVLTLQFAPELRSQVTSEYKKDAEHIITTRLATKTQDYQVHDLYKVEGRESLSQIEGKWTETTVDQRGESAVLADDLTTNSLVFMANLDDAARKELMQLIRSSNMYTLKQLQKVEKTNQGEVRTYAVTINTEAYNRVLAMYLDKIGLSVAASEVSIMPSGGDVDAEVSILSVQRQVYAAGSPAIGAPATRYYELWNVPFVLAQPSSVLSQQEFVELLGKAAEGAQSGNQEQTN